jgi:ABC-type phosphate transport system permease subunit
LSSRPPSSSPAGDHPPAGDAPPSIARRRARTGERLIVYALFLCAVLSIAVTVGIVAVLLVDTVSFFSESSLFGFLTGTVWAPGSGAGEDGLYGMLPLLNGTLMIGVGSIVVALPLGLLTAIYLSEYANPRVRGVLKPTLEILAGIPTVIVGFFALQFITPDLLRPIFGEENVFIFNAAAGSIAVGLMILPIIASISEDAMRAVPSSLREAAFGLGASKRQVSLSPAARPPSATAQRGTRRPDRGPGLLPLTVPEVRRLLVALVWTAPVKPGLVLAWSRWRRRHQARARRAHYQRHEQQVRLEY